jgi:hypothetical protein
MRFQVAEGMEVPLPRVWWATMSARSEEGMVGLVRVVRKALFNSLHDSILCPSTCMA